MTQYPRITELGRRTMTTPILFASYRVGDYPRAGLKFHPWEITSTEAVLLNAFDIIANPRTVAYTEQIRLHERKLHGFIDFAGPVLLDSGAFNFLQNPKITITPTDVASLGLELKPDALVVLDHPFPPKAEATEIQRRWVNTLTNTRVMYDRFRAHQAAGGIVETGLIPVIHGHDEATLSKAVEQLIEIWGGEPPFVGIGSLAPLARNGSKRIAIDVLLAARRMLPNAHLHCFSLGSALLMLFAFYCGINSVDSQTWIMSAAFKQAQMPGFHITRLSSQEKDKNEKTYTKTRQSFAEHLLRLVTEEGYEVRDWDQPHITAQSISTIVDAFDYVDYLEDQPGVNRIHRRACHNLFSFNFETGKVRQAIADDTLETFIQQRLKSTVYKKVFEYAVTQRSKPV